MRIANGEGCDFGTENDSGAASTAITIDVEAATYGGNTTTERSLQMIR